MSDEKPNEQADKAAAAAKAAASTGAPSVRAAAKKRAGAMADGALADQPGNAGMIEALLVERRGYVMRDLPERVAQVDEQLRIRGAKPPKGDEA